MVDSGLWQQYTNERIKANERGNRQPFAEMLASGVNTAVNVAGQSFLEQQKAKKDYFLKASQTVDIVNDKGQIVPEQQKFSYILDLGEGKQLPEGFTMKPKTSPIVGVDSETGKARTIANIPEGGKVVMTNKPQRQERETIAEFQQKENIRSASNVKEANLKQINQLNESLVAVRSKLTALKPQIDTGDADDATIADYANTAKMYEEITKEIKRLQGNLEPAQPKYQVGQILNTPKGQVKVVGFDTDGTPLIDL